jgi:3-hydroxyacyl-CoA dehydrogenase
VHSTVAVLGCGLIGASWAGLFLASGRHVRAWDPSPAARAAFAPKAASVAAEVERLSLVGRSGARGRLSVDAQVSEAVGESSFIQENAPEDAELKRSLFAEVEAATSATTVIASSTSSLVWSDLFKDLRHPGRCITAHPFNPPHLVPLVELYGPDAAVVDDASALYREVSRVPVRLRKEAVGHIANRLASAMWREAVHLVAEGIADVEDVDRAAVNGPGLRWAVVGPHMAYHLGGGPGGIVHYLKHLGPSQERRWATLGRPSLTAGVCEQLRAGVEREAAGRSIAELEALRDRGLVALLRARREVGI